MIHMLSDYDVGRYRVTTAASEYVIDLDARTLERHSTANALRGDSTPLELVSVGFCNVGQSALFWLNELDPETSTFTRSTTPVLSIDLLN